MKKRFYIYIAAVLAAVSCVYPFDIERDQVTESAIVFDGDIVVGGKFDIRVSMMSPFTLEAPSTGFMVTSLAVEDSEGTVYDGKITSSAWASLHIVSFDLESASLDRQYRLAATISLRKGVEGEPVTVSKKYSTPFMDVSRAPGKATIGFEADDENVYVSLSLKEDKDAGRFYRWGFSETYEFHSDFVPEYELDRSVDLQRTVAYILRDPNEDYPYYYCWKSQSSRESVLVSTEYFSENSIEKKVFRTIGRSTQALQIMYRMDVRMKGISRDGYYFHKTLQENSNSDGSLFAPTPSEMRGNISCEEDPSELVLGYVDVITENEFSEYLDGRYSKWKSPMESLFFPEFNFHPDDPDSEGLTPLEWYNTGYRPVMIPSDTTAVAWAAHRCINCVLDGGHKNKPAGWPTAHE